MVGWGIDSILSGKFLKIWRKEGFIRTLERGRGVRFRSITDNAGSQDVVNLVGQDVHGNRYYEDFNGDDSNGSCLATRWVELADRHEWWPSGRKIPAEWHGWLHRMYDDAPVAGNTCFYQPVFKRRHLPHCSGEPHETYPLGHPSHPYSASFQSYSKKRVYHEWDPSGMAKGKKYD